MLYKLPLQIQTIEGALQYKIAPLTPPKLQVALRKNTNGKHKKTFLGPGCSLIISHCLSACLPPIQSKVILSLKIMLLVSSSDHTISRSGDCQAIVRQSSGGHQLAVKRSSGGRQAVIRRSSGGYQTVVKRSSGGRQGLSGGHQTIIKWSSRGCQVASGNCHTIVRGLSGDHQAVIRLTFCH